ncbi:MAG: tape measure protein [Flavobacteriales bacterium]
MVKDKEFETSIRRIEARLASLTATADKEAKAVDNLVQKAVTGLSAYASLALGTNFIGDIIRVRGEFQQLEVAFQTMLGSKAASDKLLRDITEFAATTPFELTDVAAATKQLLAFGIAADDIPKTLKELGDVSAGIGAPLGEIAYLFGTIKTQGVALTQDVRQFAQRGIPVYEELAKVLNVSVEEVGNLITAGKVGFPEIQKVFENLTAEGSKFGGLMEAQSKTLVGQISNLRDAFDKMLNEIGQSGENLFADAIAGIKFLVDNYATVIDILKVLVITYGSYRAAIIATNVVQQLSIALTKGWTVAELLRYRAMVLSEKAMKLLNATMSKNPAALVITGLTAIVTSLVVFRKEADKARTAQDYLADAQAKVGDKIAEAEAKIRPYAETLKNANLSEKDRVNIYKELEKIDPKIVQGIDAKKLSYENLTANVNKYLEALRKQYKLEANKEALEESFKEEARIEKQIRAFEKERDRQIAIQDRNREALQKRTDKGAQEQLKNQAQYRKNIQDNFENDTRELYSALAKQQQISLDIASDNIKLTAEEEKKKRRTISVIKEEISLLEKKREDDSATAAERIVYDEKILKLQKELDAITGPKPSKLAEINKIEEQGLALLEKRRDLLAEIADRVAESNETNRTKEQTEIDKINDRYDKLIDNIDDYNKKVDAFNKKNPGKDVQKIGQADIVELNTARSQEITNTRLKADADAFKKYLEEQRQLFEKYEEAKKQVGIDKANELFAENLNGYESYLQLLQTETQKLVPKIQLGIANVGEELNFTALLDEYKAYTKKKSDEEIETEKRTYTELLTATVTYNQKKAAINQKYDDLEASLRKNAKIGEYDERAKILEQSREQELSELDAQLLRSSDLYRRLNQDILGFTRKRLDQEIKYFEEQLKNNKSLTPELQSLIQRVIEDYKSLRDETNFIAKNFEKLSQDLSTISNSFYDLGGAIGDLDAGLAATLETMGDIVSVGAKAANAVAQIARPDNVVGAAAAVVDTIVGIFNIGARARESRRQAEAEMKAFLNTVLQGELEVNALYRQRLLDQASINKLKLEGLKAEEEQLKKNAQQALADYQRIFELLQSEQYISGQTTRRRGGFLGIGRRTEVVNQLSSLAGLNYDQLERLFLEGRLTDRAKELFQTLQKLKQEGLDIDKALEDARREAQELFTGTTADSLLDSITDGFASGLRTASDFADNFEDLMRKAIINSLKYKYLEGPLNEFYQQFAAASESDGQLTQAEIEQLRNFYNSILENAQAQFDQLQQISGVNITGANGGNSLQGAIKGMTETQAELLAGQFGGLRITALESLNVSRAQLDAVNAIQVNTSVTVLRMNALLQKFDAYEAGSKLLNVKVQ